MKKSKELESAAKEARNAYLRDWRRRNPEKVAEYARRHWERVAASREVNNES